MDEKQQTPENQRSSWQQAPHQQGYQPVPPLYGEPQPTHQPAKPAASVAVAEKHKESVIRYPHLGLSQDEYVITEVRRHPIGLLSIWLVVGIIVLATFMLLPLYSVNFSAIADALMIQESAMPAPALLGLPLLVICGLFIVGGILATYVYNGNRFYLTNESIIQHIQISIFSKKEQHINLANIEDASYRQHGLIQTLLNYGSLRLSTEGDETTYRFQYVADPRTVVHQVTEGIESATGNAARFRDDQQPPINVGKH